MQRKEILENAITHTCGERELDYGPPTRNCANIALLWTAYLEGKTAGKLIASCGGVEMTSQYEITAEDVAWMMVMLKTARVFTGPPKADTYEDAAAYAAIAGECAND